MREDNGVDMEADIGVGEKRTDQDIGRRGTPVANAIPPSVAEKVAATERRMANEEPEGTIVDGVEDDKLWVLLRGFNKQVNHVLHPATHLPPNHPDLRQTHLPNVPYRSDTLKANLERLIKGLGPAASRGIQELACLTDWDGNFHRTSAFCTAYFVSWAYGYVVLAAAAFFGLLICFPWFRRLLFPYRPPHTDAFPLLETDDETILLTEPEKSEEVSVQVTAVLAGYASALLLGTKEEGNAVVGPKNLDAGSDAGSHAGAIVGVNDAKDSDEIHVLDQANLDGAVEVNGQKVITEVERKRNALVTGMAKATETSIGTAADYIEILQKTFSPPPVYPDRHARFRLAALLIIPCLAVHYVPARAWGRGLTLLFGIVFWGRKWLVMGIHKLLIRFPNWKEILDPRNSILSGVPTDAQFTLYLLRANERERDPLPAPPVTPALEATKEAIRQAAGTGVSEALEASDMHMPAHEATKPKKKKKKGLFRKLVRQLAGIGSDVALVGDERKLRGKIDRLVLKAKWGDFEMGGYRAKLGGVNGHLFIHEEDACISWVPLLSKSPDKVWYVDDLVEMKKDGLGTSRLALAAICGAEVASLGLSLRFARTADDVNLSDMSDDEQLRAAQAAKETLEFKSVEGREALFNRLIAMGSQRWEML
ncbi:hypothetical protein CspeluHIS016_0800960 [Cutaneotrichosporon spelunceum]|uniref:Uncharacterized protein n=1 Tax=Cutaneotrichosporon spelunceum TaxID=1672016 RepID=A0AAD3TYZ8_9TREE|nr:hypothetical protein CspeluHIS016_0800960 [Cutaneotrichosporon spelunceum]